MMHWAMIMGKCGLVGSVTASPFTTSGGVSCICSIAASWSPMPKFSVAVSDTGQTPATLTGRGNTVASRGIAVHVLITKAPGTVAVWPLAQKRLDKGWHGSRDVFSHLGLLTGCDGEARQGALGRTILSRRLCCPLGLEKLRPRLRPRHPIDGSESKPPSILDNATEMTSRDAPSDR